MENKNKIITIQGEHITVTSNDYLSLTDMLKAKDGEFFISDWLRNRNTVEFLGIWERIHNPDFNYGEFATIKSSAGLNSYKISVKEWTSKTNAIGLTAKAGRYGGTYAHKDIAFEFAMWISAEFKIFLIKEFQRLKDQEQAQLGWDVRRNLTKINYRIHTDAIKQNLIPHHLSKAQTNFVYASEADVLNVAQLVCLANMENLNAVFINDGLPQNERLTRLNQIAISQMRLLIKDKIIEKIERDK